MHSQNCSFRSASTTAAVGMNITDENGWQWLMVRLDFDGKGHEELTTYTPNFVRQLLSAGQKKSREGLAEYSSDS